MRVPVPPPDVQGFISEVEGRKLRQILSVDLDDARYLHWDDLRWRPIPDGLGTHEEWWLAVKLARRSTHIVPGLEGVKGRSFGYTIPSAAQEVLHTIDGNLMGQIGVEEEIVNPATRSTYLFSSLLEEAVRSSQLEGAVTTRKQARDIIQAGRKPQTLGERMVVNNYMAMEFVGTHRHEPLTVELILEVHRIVTDGTLDNPDAAGRFQNLDESRVSVWDDVDDKILHQPPPAGELLERAQALCDFANETGGPFLHPVIRSIILHFWLAYDHPFEDGNGRTARAIFYWSMLHHNYWLVEFLSISKILREAPAKYGRAFLYTETDDNDLTYFLLHQLNVIARSIDVFNEYIRRKSSEIREVEELAKNFDVNHRQLALLTHALKSPGYPYTYKSHATTHRVVRQTARTDLLDLAERDLLLKMKSGNRNIFVAPADLASRLKGAQ